MANKKLVRAHPLFVDDVYLVDGRLTYVLTDTYTKLLDYASRETE